MDKPTPANILIELSLELGYGREVLRGVREEIDALGLPWRLRLQLSGSLANLSADGLILGNFQRSLDNLRDSALPLVVVSAQPVSVNFPFARVTNDQDAIGVEAAKTFLQLGYLRFAYAAFHMPPVISGRVQGYVRFLEEQGHEVLPLSSGHSLDEELAKLFANDHRPVGIFAASDLMGWSYVDSCQRVGIQVPGQSGIIGCDNDQLFCSCSRPALSSVAVASREIGRRAVRTLRDRMQHPDSASSEELLPPRAVVLRQSTSCVSGDPVVAVALQYINENYSRPLQLNDIAQACGLSVRGLQDRMKSARIRPPSKILTEVRIQRAQEKLLASDLPVIELALECGFTSAAYFHQVFRRQTGMTPSAYRQQFGS